MPFRYIRKYLSMSKVKTNSVEVNNFSSRIIGQDGVFILKMIGDISSDILVQEIVIYLWNEKKQSVQEISAPQYLVQMQATPMTGNSAQEAANHKSMTSCST